MDDIKILFNKFDTNGDGKINASELRSLIRTISTDGTVATPGAIDSIMSDIDTDADGLIDLKEFTRFYLASFGNGDDDDKHVKEAFDVYDHDKNGLISASELHKTLGRLGQDCTLDDCENMIKAVDVDGDGHVNFEEFKIMMKRIG